MWVTSELNQDVDLLVQYVLKLGRVGVYIIIHLLSHLQQNLLILQPSN